MGKKDGWQALPKAGFRIGLARNRRQAKFFVFLFWKSMLYKKGEIIMKKEIGTPSDSIGHWGISRMRHEK